MDRETPFFPSSLSHVTQFLSNFPSRCPNPLIKLNTIKKSKHYIKLISFHVAGENILTDIPTSSVRQTSKAFFKKDTSLKHPMHKILLHWKALYNFLKLLCVLAENNLVFQVLPIKIQLMKSFWKTWTLLFLNALSRVSHRDY